MALSVSEPVQISDLSHTRSDIKRGSQLLNSSLLTDHGKRWLVRATDPFHDSQVEPSGYPDVDLSATVVQEINLSANVSVPSGVATGANWDCHIHNLPNFAAAQFGSVYPTPWTFNPATGGIASNVAINYAGGGLQILSCPAGQATYPENGVTTGLANITSASINPYSLIGGKCRVVGWAFEVVNTTAEIYRQGLVTAYRMPQSHESKVFNQLSFDQGGVLTYSWAPVTTYALPPSTVSEALLYPGSKQWPAERGYYGVCVQRELENPMRTVDNTPFAMLERSFTSTSGSVLSGILSPFTVNAQAGTSTAYPVLQAPFHTTGVYLTGLSNQTTLQVNMKMILEVAPSSRSPFITLAHPSPSYDPEAQRIYSMLVNELPVGVPFDENPDGEWFQNILGTLGNLASSIPHPILQAVGQGLQMARGAVPLVVKAFGQQQPERRLPAPNRTPKKKTVQRPAVKRRVVKAIRKKADHSNA